ncbi:MAG: sigma-54 dependent transcriptional regulator [Verrucomicrobiota bacterium]
MSGKGKTPKRNTILVVDPDEDYLGWCKRHLAAEDVEVFVETDAERAWSRCEKSTPDLLIVELRVAPINGLELLRRVRQQDPDAMVLMITGFPPSSVVIESMKLGAYDFLRRESLTYDLRPTVEAALSAQDEIRSVSSRSPQSTLRDEDYRETIIGKSAAMQEVFKMIGRVSRSDAPVLITGESGCGKEIVAKAVHQFSLRSKREYVAINCAAIPGDLLESELFGHEKGSFTGASAQRIGRFEQCDGGTLFLDEIGDMPLPVQSKILRVLQEGEFSRVGGNQTLTSDVRILAATNKDLEGNVEQGSFREDLFYRLNVVRIELPSLRERREDIPLLVDFFLERQARQRGSSRMQVSGDAMQLLTNYDWPGNVRELENTIQRASVLATSHVLLPKDLPLGRPNRRGLPGEGLDAATVPDVGVPGEAPVGGASAPDSPVPDPSTEGVAGVGGGTMDFEAAIQVLLSEAERNEDLKLLPFLEREMTKFAMDRMKGNQVRAAQLLGITRGTLRKRLERFAAEEEMAGSNGDA